MNFWAMLLANALNSAAQTSASAIQSGANPRTVGMAAGVGAVAGILSAILAHPAAQHPAVQQITVTLPAPQAGAPAAN